MANHSPSDFHSLLDLVEDFYRWGFRRSEPSPGPIQDTREGAEGKADAATGGEVAATLESIAGEIAECTQCPLHQGRNRTVPGEGSSRPVLMCIGEGPGAEENRTGRPFVGPAGQYLDRWLDAISLDRMTDCFIGNIVKCRPPGNRDPLPDESGACIPYLHRQIEILQPKVIVSLGRIATQILLGTSDGIGAMRGKWFSYRNIPLMPTYHPSAVLRNSDLRRAVWEDMKQVRSRLDDV